MEQTRKNSDVAQRKASSSDPFKDLPIIWCIGKSNILFMILLPFNSHL
jgi:hypothetical protein